MQVDSHAHVFDVARFPYASSPGYKPPPQEAGTVDQFLAVLDAHGFTHGVVVNPTTSYGTDNRCLLNALNRAQGRLKGIALVDPGVTDRELDDLGAAGVVGIRLNLVYHGLTPVSEAAHLRLLERLRERGWIVEVYTTADKLEFALPVLRDLGVTALVDHCGKPDPSMGLDQAGFRALVEFGRQGAGWVKLSGPFRFSQEPWPHLDADPFVEALIRAFTPKRIVWGSDWPFIQIDTRTDYGPIVQCLHRWVPDAEDRRQVLTMSPKQLFGFVDADG